MAEVAGAGDLRDVKLVQRPPFVEAAVAERRSGVFAGYGIEIVIPAVTLITAPMHIDAQNVGVAVGIDLARIGGLLTDPPCRNVAGGLRGMILRVGDYFRRPEGYGQRDQY
jgi:hypothetical protein